MIEHHTNLEIPFWGANTITVTLGCAVFGALAGSVGTFVLARKQSLLADVTGHAALPGVALAFLIGEWAQIGGRSPWLLFLGGGVTALLAAWSTPWLARKRRLGADGANAVTLAAFFGLGTVLFSLVQSHPTGAQGGLRRLLFGNAAAMTNSDALAIATIAIAALLTLILLFKEFSLLAFDEDAARVLGLPVRRLDWLLLLLLVATVVTGMQVAGIALVVSMLIAPAAAARVIGGSFGRTASIAACFGVACAVAGAMASRSVEHFPTGSAMALAATVVFFLSIPCSRILHARRERNSAEARR